MFVAEDKPKANGLKRSKTQNLIVAEEKKQGGLTCKDLCAYSWFSCGCFTIPFILLASTIPALLYLYISEWLRTWVRQGDEEQQKSFYRNVFLGTVLLFFATSLIRNLAVGSMTLRQT